MNNCSSIIDMSGNDLFALTTAIAAILGQSLSVAELELLANVFGVLSDALNLYATQIARNSSKSTEIVSNISEGTRK